MSRPPVLRLFRCWPAFGLVLVLAAAGRAFDGDAQTAAVAAGAVVPAAPAADDQERSLEWATKRAAELGGGVRPEDVLGPHRVEPDLFHPDRRQVTPALGGRVIVHLEAHPANLCYPIENSAVVTFMLYEMHDSLLDFNWETWRNDLELAAAMHVEDTLVLKGGRGENDTNIVYGKVADGGGDWVVTSGSPWNKAAERRVPKADVEALHRATVYTFELRKGVTWHDGHPFDAQDVLFSTELYRNPAVDCDEKRFRFEEIVRGEVLDTHVVRYFFKQQYFGSESTFNSTLCILPRHLYDLTDPDCRDHKADATIDERGAYINDNPHNIQFVGLGPYKLRAWEANQYIEAVRYDGYWETDPAKRGYVDTIRWRYIDGDDPAFQALLNDEIDIFRRVKTEDYFGEATSQKLFTDKFYKAYSYTGQYGYTCWNMHRKKFQDPKVRQALAHAFDTLGWVANKYQGLAVPVTGPAFFLSPFYNQEIKVLPYDPALAEEMLAEAGWYDRNGNGTVDKDGEEFEIEFLMPSGNKASESMGQKLQESLAQVGVAVRVQPLEWASFLERMLNRDFDSCNLAWVLYEPESDPKQIWHSSEAGIGVRSSNHAGYADPKSDSLIDALRVEPDVDKRVPLWHELHQRIYELQPYLFGQTPPSKFAFSRKLRGVKLYNMAPGFRVRDMYFEAGTPDTRPLTTKK
jgi:peptide/nickel transport system substrate-binding protein